MCCLTDSRVHLIGISKKKKKSVTVYFESAVSIPICNVTKWICITELQSRHLIDMFVVKPRDLSPSVCSDLVFEVVSRTIISQVWAVGGKGCVLERAICWFKESSGALYTSNIARLKVKSRKRGDKRLKWSHFVKNQQTKKVFLFFFVFVFFK